MYFKIAFKYSYNICIRQEEGYCCIRYTLCGDDRSWSLDNKDAAKSEVGTQCSFDYLDISGASLTCTTASGTPAVERICGGILATVPDMTVNAESFCDCTAPFQIRVKTDATNDGTAPTATTQARGSICNLTISDTIKLHLSSFCIIQVCAFSTNKSHVSQVTSFKNSDTYIIQYT